MNIYDLAWKNIVKPTQIRTKKYLLGPSQRNIDGHEIIRIDMEVLNRNNKKISGFIFYSPTIQSETTLLYLHGNGGSKVQAMPFIPLIPKFKMNIAAFDFLGCGNSDSEVLTYGVNQVFDIRDMLQEIRKKLSELNSQNNKVGRITLWGRSMGALCSVMFAEMYSYQVSGLILDSPFRSLSKVVDRIATRHVPLPNFTIQPLLYIIKNRASKQANYDIFSIDYLNIFKKLNHNMPILFIFSHFDGVVPAQQVFQFYNAYKGPKDLCQIYQTHDEDRNQDLYKQGMMWLTRTKRKNIQGHMQARIQLYTNKQNNKQKTSFC